MLLRCWAPVGTWFIVKRTVRASRCAWKPFSQLLCRPRIEQTGLLSVFPPSAIRPPLLPAKGTVILALALCLPFSVLKHSAYMFFFLAACLKPRSNAEEIAKHLPLTLDQVLYVKFVPARRRSLGCSFWDWVYILKPGPGLGSLTDLSESLFSFCLASLLVLESPVGLVVVQVTCWWPVLLPRPFKKSSIQDL